jgi:hypothetical protein
VVHGIVREWYDDELTSAARARFSRRVVPFPDGQVSVGVSVSHGGPVQGRARLVERLIEVWVAEHRWRAEYEGGHGAIFGDDNEWIYRGADGERTVGEYGASSTPTGLSFLDLIRFPLTLGREVGHVTVAGRSAIRYEATIPDRTQWKIVGPPPADLYFADRDEELDQLWLRISGLVDARSYATVEFISVTADTEVGEGPFEL